MDQIITLLTNLFNLTKVASVTLPGLVLAGAILLFFKPSQPIDTIRVPIESQVNTKVLGVQTPCSDFSTLGSAASKKSGGKDHGCAAGAAPAVSLEPACALHSVNLNVFEKDDTLTPVMTTGPKPSEAGAAIASLVVPTPGGTVTTAEAIDAHNQLVAFATSNGTKPWDPKILIQLVLEQTQDRLQSCSEVENSWKGQEEASNTQLAADIQSIDKQRSDMQDAYIASLKTNDAAISQNFLTRLSAIMALEDDYRARYRVNLVSENERALRLQDIKTQQDIVTARLEEPDRLRPIKEFDVYTQGLVNHIVGFILLSLALSLILVAFNRTVLGKRFESIFPGW